MTGPDPVTPLLDLPGVSEGVQRAREAVDRMRAHPGLRAQPHPCRVEAGVWAAWASARLEGVQVPVELVRHHASGAAPQPDATGAVLAGVLRTLAQADRLAAGAATELTTAPRQVLARLHLAAGAGLEDERTLGRPETPDPAALARVQALPGLLGSGAPALLRVALLDAEVSTTGLFRTGNEVVARAAARAVQIGSGLDPSGCCVPELGMVADPARRRAGLAAYRSGTADGVGRWLLTWSDWVVAGAEHGEKVAASVLTHRPLMS